MMRRLAVASIALVCLVVAAACTSDSPKSTATTTTSDRSNSSTTTSPDTDDPDAHFTAGWPEGSGGDCGEHTPGKGHVLMTFCNGPATVTAIFDGTPHELKGVCWVNGPNLEIDAGVAPGPGFTGPWPDYVTTQVPLEAGAIRGAVVFANVGGVRRQSSYALGTLAPALAQGTGITADTLRTQKVTGEVKSIAAIGDDEVTATFDCGGG